MAASTTITLGNGFKLSISPFMESGYLFNSMTLHEELGGEIAYGEVSFTSNGDNMNLITSQETININIVKDKGITYDIYGFITSRKYLNNEVDINFLCCEKKFITEKRVVTYTDISEAVNSLYSPSNRINIGMESDINNDIEIHQNGQSDYALCKKLAQSYKYNTIFAFGLEGFMIKDVDQSESETTNLVTSMSDNSQENKFSINYFKQFDIEPEENESSENILTMTNNQDNYLLHRSYDQLMNNFLYNSRYDTEMHTNFSTKYLYTIPDYKIGDMIVYKSMDKFPRTKYIVSRIDISIDLNEVKSTVYFRGIENDKGL